MDDVEATELAMEAALDQLVARWRGRLAEGEEVTVHSIYDTLEASMENCFGLDLSQPVDPEMVGGIMAVLASVTHRLVRA
jgi:hypothetical protein